MGTGFAGAGAEEAAANDGYTPTGSAATLRYCPSAHLLCYSLDKSDKAKNIMTSIRKGESEAQPRYRKSRFFMAIDKWYFLTREGTVEGPFKRRLEAEKNLNSYIRAAQN